MITGNPSAALIPNQPNRDTSALSLFLIHPFKLLSSLGSGSSPPPELHTHCLVIMLQQVP